MVFLLLDVVFYMLYFLFVKHGFLPQERTAGRTASLMTAMIDAADFLSIFISS